MTEPPADGAEDRTGIDRRRLLGTLGTSALSLALAGCSDLTTRRFEATPVGLPAEARRQLGYPEAATEAIEVDRRREIAGQGVRVIVTSHLHTYPVGGDEGTDLPHALSFGVLATPQVEVFGERLNPLTTQPLGDLVAGERGWQLLRESGAVEGDAPAWTEGPIQLRSADATVLDTATEVSVFGGLVESEDEDGQNLVTVYATRVTNDDDAVIAAGATSESGVELEDGSLESLFDRRAAELEQRVERIIRTGEMLELEPGIESIPLPSVSLKDVRLVQLVEDTFVNNRSAHREPDPTLVAGDETALVFDMDVADVSNLSSGGKVEFTVERTTNFGTTTDSFHIEKADLADMQGRPGRADEVLAVLHRISNDGTSNEVPVWPLQQSTQQVVLTASSPVGALHDRVTINRGPDFEIQQLPPLKVGFITVRAPNLLAPPYGDSGGTAANYRRSVNSAVEYLKRTYPGGLMAYRHDLPVPGEPDSTKRAYLKDHRSARKTLEQARQASAFPGLGQLYTEDVSTSRAKSELAANGFDVWVFIAPRSHLSGNERYYKYHGKGNLLGQYLGSHKVAVGAQEAAAGNEDVGHSTTVAQEIGHFMKTNPYDGPSGHPMAQRDDKGVDATVGPDQVDRDHARHTNSRLDNGKLDMPGVFSTCYDLSDEQFRLVTRFSLRDGTFSVGDPPNHPSQPIVYARPLESFMTYDSGHLWTDARIHQAFLDNLYRHRDDEYRTVTISATGRTSEDGSVTYDDVAVLDTIAEDAVPDDEEPAPDAGRVDVSLLAPDETVVQSATVPDRLRTEHHDETTYDIVLLDVPFPDATAEVVSVRDGAETRFNPITRPIGDAFADVPDRGLTDPETVRENVAEDLTTIREWMKDDNYAEARTVLTERLRPRFASRISDYERRTTRPTRESILSLTDRMIRRLGVLANYG